MLLLQQKQDKIDGRNFAILLCQKRLMFTYICELQTPIYRINLGLFLFTCIPYISYIIPPVLPMSSSSSRSSRSRCQPQNHHNHSESSCESHHRHRRSHCRSHSRSRDRYHSKERKCRYCHKKSERKEPCPSPPPSVPPPQPPKKKECSCCYCKPCCGETHTIEAKRDSTICITIR